jgi:hypothetical protein
MVVSCAAVLVCLTACACGYTFAATPLSNQYATIAVPAFKNQTFEPDLQIRFNNILVRELENDGRLKLVDDPAAADLVLRGALTAFDPRAASLIRDDDIGQFRITIAATATLQAVDADEPLWRGEIIKGTDFYLTEGGRSRDEAIDGALEELAETILYEALENSW